ncbi:protein split ends-like [Thrips palmi]|uniref:Protein split ends-like n=1 Tax=Thrips palmi TaxID=161013 RepID=A0A6P9A1Y6_THRPL|nr:protein split ends-like [Thrips palmi]
MASAADENSPPRLDALPKSRRLSSLIDSPSRVTRSQVRRLSSAPSAAAAEAPLPMSPKPTVSTRRRSAVAARSDAAHQDEAPASQEEPDTGKALPRRRSVRKSFADGNDEGPLSSRSSKLSSIDEDSKANSKEESKPTAMSESRPVTRRTRASMASALEPEPEICLPTTRRTRRSSISSVSSITSSVVASPRTRSRKNLSPVPSPTFSEVSTMSEVPETSPASKTSPSKDSSPLVDKSEKKLGTPRQLQFHNSDSAKTKRSSFIVSEHIEGEDTSSKTDGVESCQPARRSQGRLSSKSPLKFVETPMDDSVKSNHDVEKKSNDEGNVEVEFNKARSSVGRLSLSANKSSRLSLSSNKSTPNKSSPSLIEKFDSSPNLSLSGSRRSSKRLSLSSNKASPAENLKSDLHLTESEDKVNSESRSPAVFMYNRSNVTEENAGSPRLTWNGSLRESAGRLSSKSSPFKFDVSDGVSPKKSQPETASSENVQSYEASQDVTSNSSVLPEKSELDNSTRSSTRKISVGKSPLLGLQELRSENSSSPDSSVTKGSTDQQIFDVEDSSTDPSLVEVVVEKRNSLGRLSLSSKQATPSKLQSPAGPSKVSDIETKGRFSLSSNKSTPAKSAKFDTFEVSNTESQQSSLSRLSLSSNKSTPAKSPQFDNPELSNTDSNQKTSVNRLSLSSNKATPSKSSKAEAVATQEHISTPSTSGSSDKLSPANSSDSGSPQSADEDAPNTFLSRFSLSFNKSTPAKASPAKSPNTPQVQLNESQRSSIGRLSLSSNKSPQPEGLRANDEMEHVSDNEESDSVSSADPSQRRESVGKLNLSGKVETSSSTKSTGRPSLTPSKILNISHHQEEDASSDDDASNEDNDDANNDANHANGDASNDSFKLSSKIFSHLNPSEVSRRASTGNLSKKPLISDQKARASMGPLINPSTSYPDDSEDENDSSNSSGGIGDSSNTANDRSQFGMGELTLSPIKQDSPSKKRSLTPASDKTCNEPERQTSPSNLLEKSTVFDDDSFASNTETSEQALEMSVSSLKPSNLNKSINNENNVSQLADAADLDSSKRFLKTPTKDVPNEESITTSKVSSQKKLGSTKVYQAAAVLMSGGKISDFDDDDSDDSQLQTVFSPSTMSKKEIRLEKKARRKAEKEARKKLKQEWNSYTCVNEIKSLKQSMAKSFARSLEVAEAATKPDYKENTHQTQISPHPESSKKKKSIEANVARSEVSNVMDEKLDLSEKTSSKRRKTLSQSECDLPLEDDENNTPSPLKNDEKPAETDIQSAEKLKKLKRSKSGSADLETGVSNHHEEIGTGNTLPDDVKTACKKKKKKAKTITATEMELNAEVPPASKDKKKKLKKKGLVDDAPTAELPLKAKKKKLKKSVLGDEAPLEDISIKKKKKKQKLASENHSVEETTTEALKIKKKKKKNKDSVLQPSSASEENFSNVLSHDLQKQKKKKKRKLSSIDGTVDMDENSSTKVMLVDDTNATHSGSGKTQVKKLKKKKEKLMPDENKEVSSKQHKKKLKEKRVLELVPSTADGSDSEDEPTSVSFAAGKNAALALMEAAALNIKQQKEMKKQKIKEVQEKRRQEKSAKMLKQKKNIIDVDVGSHTSKKGGFPVSSSKIIFDDQGISQKVKPPKRLPTDLLESLSEQPATKYVKRPDGSKEKVPADAVSSEELKKREMKKARILARKLEKQKLLQSDYVPLEGVLGATRFGVVPLRNIMLAKKLQRNKLAEEAANFRQANLFGNRIRRTPISSAISYQEKRKASGTDGLVYKK